MKKRIGCLLLTALVLLPLLLSCAPQTNELIVTVLDVGQGDATLLSLNGHHLLIDTGSASSRASLLGELARLGVEELDAILVTHPHEDHYGNARVLLETHTVEALLTSNAESEELGYRILLEVAAKEEVQVRALADGDNFSWHGALCEVYCPLPEDAEPNNSGLLLRVRYGSCKLLFTGDAERAAELALLASDADLSCDVLKVAHHGSRTACSEAFLQATAPRLATISCAADNDYGFPHDEVLEGLAAVGATVYRTDLSGTLRFVCDGKSIIYEE